MLKREFTKILSDKLDIPLEGIASVPTIQLIGNTIMSIDGCVSIKKYEADAIVIRTKEYMLKIDGTGLSMLTFSQGRVNVRGEIKAFNIEVI